MLNTLPTRLSRTLYFTSPNEQEQKRIATIARFILLILALTSTVYTIVVMLFLPQLYGILWVFFGLLGLLGVNYLLLERGFVRSACGLLLALVWTAILLGVSELGGLNDIRFATFCIPIIMAGLLLGGAEAMVFSTLSTLVGLIQVAQAPSPLLIEELIGVGAVFLLTGLLLYVADRGMKRALQESYDAQTQLSQMNQVLYREMRNHQQAAKALEESEERYRLLLEMAPVCISVGDLEARRMLYVNPAGARMFGVNAPDEVIGLHFSDVLSMEETAVAHQHFDRMAEGESVPNLREYRLNRLDGRTISVEGSSVVIDYKGRKAVLGVYNDITERKQAQQELMQAERMRAEIEQERRVVQLRESFIRMASHQFRTPLSIIRSSRDNLTYYFDRLTPERRQEHLNKIGDQVTHMQRMLDDVMTLSKASAGMMEVHPVLLSLETVSRQLIGEFAEIAPQHRIVLDGNAPTLLLLDEDLLRHALMNLLSNAVKYSPPDSTVTLTLCEESDSILLSVRDQGIGIPPEDQPRLFETFFRASNTRKIEGTGLGLAIVKSCVEAQGGTISFESEPGAGTTFHLKFPLRAATVPGR
ncbi:MAG: ATP-binding protein [bacterium]|nr:ATP-binding protein [bacterium]